MPTRQATSSKTNSARVEMYGAALFKPFAMQIRPLLGQRARAAQLQSQGPWRPPRPCQLPPATFRLLLCSSASSAWPHAGGRRGRLRALRLAGLLRPGHQRARAERDPGSLLVLAVFLTPHNFLHQPHTTSLAAATAAAGSLAAVVTTASPAATALTTARRALSPSPPPLPSHPSLR